MHSRIRPLIMKFDLMFVIQEPCTVPGLLDIINVSRYFGSVRELGEGEETKLNVALNKRFNFSCVLNQK